MDSVPEGADFEFFLRKLLPHDPPGGETYAEYRQRAAKQCAAQGWREDLYCPEMPPCTPLLDDPGELLRNSARHPAHVCLPICQESTSRWVTENFVLDLADIGRDSDEPDGERAAINQTFGATWPLPVGRKAALAARPRANGTLLTGTPFSGAETALLVLPLRYPDATVTFFGLGIAENEERSHYRPSGSVFTVTGRNPSHRAITTVIASARCWWSRIDGISVLGRPSGSTISRTMLETTRAALTASEGRPPTQEMVAWNLHVDVSTVKRAANEHVGGWRNLDR